MKTRLISVVLAGAIVALGACKKEAPPSDGPR
jgi:hypothetical protein